MTAPDNARRIDELALRVSANEAATADWLRPPYGSDSESFRRGWGKISDDESQYEDVGRYLLTEYVYNDDTNTWVESAHPPGYKDVIAYEIHGDTSCKVGDIVLFWEAVAVDGFTVILFEKGGGGAVLWGKVISDWSEDNDPPAKPNEVPVNPCDAEGNNVDAAVTITCYIHTPRKADPTAAIPEAVPLASGDVVAYHPIGVNDGSSGDRFGLLIDTETMRGVWDTPDTIDPSTITGSNETAQSDTWDRTSQGVNDGASIKLTTRVVYNDGAETPILYGFHRTFTFDTTGRLALISAETRYTIDAPEDCP